MARERVRDWPGGRLRIVATLDLPGGVIEVGSRDEAEAVPFGDGLALPQPLVVPVRSMEGEPLAEVEIGLVGGRPGCTVIRASGDRPLTGTLLRQLPPLGRIVREAVQGAVVRVVRDESGEIVGERPAVAGPGFGDSRRALDSELSGDEGKRARRTLSDEFLRDVAAVYREATAQGLPPAREIRARWPTQPANARRWVAHARSRGFLGHAPGPRRAGEIEPTEEGEAR